MTKYTDEQIIKLHDIRWPECKNWPSEDKLGCGSPSVQSFIDYLRTDAKADIEAGFWDELIDPIEQARLDAREICAKTIRQIGYDADAKAYLTGNRDRTGAMRCVFRALCQERGLEVPE